MRVRLHESQYFNKDVEDFARQVYEVMNERWEQYYNSEYEMEMLSSREVADEAMEAGINKIKELASTDFEIYRSI